MAKPGLGTIAIAGAACLQATILGAQTKPSPIRHEIVLSSGTPLTVRLKEALDTRRDRPGTRFTAYLAAALVQKEGEVLARGTVCHGHLVESKPSGRFRGRAVMALTLDSVEWNGQSYRVVTSAAARTTQIPKRRNLVWIGSGAGTGAAIGAIAGGGIGALIGAGAGAAAGTTGALGTGKRNLQLAPETRLTFRLREPVTVRM